MVLENRVRPKSKTRNNKKWKRTGEKTTRQFSCLLGIFYYIFSSRMRLYVFPIILLSKNFWRFSPYRIYILSPPIYVSFSVFFIGSAPIYRKSKYFFSVNLFIVIIIKSSMIGGKIRCVFANIFFRYRRNTRIRFEIYLFDGRLANIWRLMAFIYRRKLCYVFRWIIYGPC